MLFVAPYLRCICEDDFPSGTIHTSVRCERPHTVEEALSAQKEQPLQLILHGFSLNSHISVSWWNRSSLYPCLAENNAILEHCVVFEVELAKQYRLRQCSAERRLVSNLTSSCVPFESKEWRGRNL